VFLSARRRMVPVFCASSSASAFRAASASAAFLALCVPLLTFTLGSVSMGPERPFGRSGVGSGVGVSALGAFFEVFVGAVEAFGLEVFGVFGDLVRSAMSRRGRAAG